MGMWRNSAVNMLSGAVSFGVIALSPFGAFAFFDFGIAFGRGLVSFPCGELEAATARPLRVVLRSRSSSTVDLGVGGENSGCSIFGSSVPQQQHTTELDLPACHDTARPGNIPRQDHIHPGLWSALLLDGCYRQSHVLDTKTKPLSRMAYRM